MTALRRVEAWAEYTTALSRAIEQERDVVRRYYAREQDSTAEYEQDEDSLAAARKRVDGLLWTTPEGYVLQNEHHEASRKAS